MLTTALPLDPALVRAAARHLPEITPTLVLADAIQDAGDPNRARWCRAAAHWLAKKTPDLSPQRRGRRVLDLVAQHEASPTKRDRLSLAVFGFLWSVTHPASRCRVRFAWPSVLGIAGPIDGPAAVGDPERPDDSGLSPRYSARLLTAARALSAGRVAGAAWHAIDATRADQRRKPCQRLMWFVLNLLPNPAADARPSHQRPGAPRSASLTGTRRSGAPGARRAGQDTNPGRCDGVGV